MAFLFLVGGLAHTENAIANGDTRTLHLYHIHTHESIAATYLVDGRYDPATLQRLNYFLRDWRNNDETNMDPRLFDVVWETYRESGSTQPIEIISAYRSPATNAMLRRRSKGVAAYSEHMLGKAMDIHFADVPMSKIQAIAMHIERGGVGYYPTSGIPFVHVDVGSIRYWPRMSYDALARLFPDGKAVFLAADGRHLPRYEEARAETAARDNEPALAVASPRPKSFFAMLFGGGGPDTTAAAAPQPRAQTASFRRLTEGDQTASIRPRAAAVKTDNRQKTVTREASLEKRARGSRLVWQAGAPSRPQPGIERVAGLQTPRPLPPHRPNEVAASMPEASRIPLPPARPGPVTARAHVVPTASGVTPLLRAANVPAVITQGSRLPNARSVAGTALAYAAPTTDAMATPIPAVGRPTLRRRVAIRPAVGLQAPISHKPVELVAARLDVSNFRTMLGPIPIARTPGESELGATVGARRDAARIAQLVFGPPSVVVARFGSVVSDLRTRDFTGPAVRPLGLLFSEFGSANRAESRRID